MANPFLALGGIAVGIATAAFGILLVPGWVASVQDTSAINDLRMISEAQAASVALNGEYAGKLSALQNGDLGLSFTVTRNRVKHLSVRGDRWCGVVLSDSGRYFAASDTRSEAFGARTLGLAIARGCGAAG